MADTRVERALREQRAEAATARHKALFAQFLIDTFERDQAPRGWEGEVHTNGYAGLGRYNVRILPELPDDEQEPLVGLYLRRKKFVAPIGGNVFDQDVDLVEGLPGDVARCTGFATELGGLTQSFGRRRLWTPDGAGAVRDGRAFDNLVALANAVMDACGLEQFS